MTGGACPRTSQQEQRAFGPREFPRCQFEGVNPGVGGDRKGRSGCNRHLGRGATCWGIVSLAAVRVRQLGRRLTDFKRLFCTPGRFGAKTARVGDGPLRHLFTGGTYQHRVHASRELVHCKSKLWAPSSEWSGPLGGGWCPPENIVTEIVNTWASPRRGVAFAKFELLQVGEERWRQHRWGRWPLPDHVCDSICG